MSNAIVTRDFSDGCVNYNGPIAIVVIHAKTHDVRVEQVAG